MPRPRKPRLNVDFDSQAVARQSLWETVAKALRGAILSGEIPPGTSLVEADLAGRFGVSRGPIRDALRELAREGIVVDLPRRGTVVSTLTISDTRDVYAIREGLEVVAVRQAIERATQEDLVALRRPLLAMENAWSQGAAYDVSLAADLEFHRSLVQLSANARLIALYEQMLSQTLLLVRVIAVENPRLQLAMRKSAHRDILKALLARDVEAGQRAMIDHYAYAQQRMFNGIRVRQARTNGSAE